MNKISIAIIDDESLVRLGIKSSVEWENYGYEIIGEADNGQNGLEMIQQKQPDIVLLDICMPVMDGISLAKNLYEQNSPVILVFLSGYAEFEYARQALTYKVYEYILKPIKAEELHSVFRRISELLNQSGNHSDTGNYYDKLIQKARLYMEENLSVVTLKQTALHIGLSSSYLSSIYKQQTGNSFSDDIQNMKMQIARQLLNDGDLKTYEISEKLGYDNPKNFTRAFRSYYGFSPRDYKKNGGE